MSVLVEFPIQEAEAMLAERIDQDLTIPEAEACASGYARLEQAVAVERGSGGDAEKLPPLAQLAEELVGQDVVVRYKEGGSAAGRLHPDSSPVLHLETASNRFRGIPLSRIASIEPVDVAA